jgi:hypothetical protein
MTGVGLLYQQGYFRQVLDCEGRQQALYPYNDPIQLPVAPLRGPDGAWLRVETTLPGRRLRLQVWNELMAQSSTRRTASRPKIAARMIGPPLEDRCAQIPSRPEGITLHSQAVCVLYAAVRLRFFAPFGGSTLTKSSTHQNINAALRRPTT